MIAAFFGKWWLELIGVAALISIPCVLLIHYKIENLTIQRDQAVLAMGVAEAALKDHQRISAAQIAALENIRREDEERQNVQSNNLIEIERDRLAGNGPVAPVLRNTAERLRQRQLAKAASAGRNP